MLFLTVHPDIKPEHLASLKNVLSGAAPLGASDEERFLEKANKPINMLQGTVCIQCVLKNVFIFSTVH